MQSANTGKRLACPWQEQMEESRLTEGEVGETPEFWNAGLEGEYEGD